MSSTGSLYWFLPYSLYETVSDATHILQIAQDVADDVHLERPETLFPELDNGEREHRHLLRALHKTVEFLATYYDWPILRNEKTFTSTTNGAQTSAIPSDFRRMIKGTMFDRTNSCRVLGPQPPEEYQRRLAMSLTVGPPIFTMRGTSLLLRTHYATGATVAYEYISTQVGWAADGTTARTKFLDDNDVTLWSDEVIRLGMIWAYLHRDGNRSNEDFEAFRDQIHNEIGAAGAGDSIDMGGFEDVRDPNFPESFPALI